MKNIYYLLVILLLASCSTVQKGGIIQSRTYKLKPNKSWFAKTVKNNKSKPLAFDLTPKTYSKNSIERNESVVNEQPKILEQASLVESTNSINEQNQNEVKYTSTPKLKVKHSPRSRINRLTKLSASNMTTPEGRETHWAAIVGLVTGILSLFVFTLLLSICAIVFSAIALSKINQEPEVYKGKGMAIAGLVLGIVALLIVAVYIGYVLALM